MNTVVVVVVAMALIVGAGVLVVDEVTHPGCKGEAMAGVPASPSAHHYRLTLWDQERYEPLRTCMYDGSGRKMFDQTLDATGEIAQYWDVYLPRPLDLWIVDGGWRQYADLSDLHSYTSAESCTPPPELFYHDGPDDGWLISGDCHGSHVLPARKPAEQKLQTNAMLPSDDGPSIPGTGGAVAAAVGLGGLLILGIHFRRPLQWAFLGMFTRIVAPRVLEQSVRAEIHQLVQQEPGIRPMEIGERLELAPGQTVHHLRVLTQTESLILVRDGFARHYFIRGQHSPQRMRQLAALRSASVAKLHQAMVEHPGAPLSTLANLGGLSKARASRLAKRLQHLGLARAERQGKHLRLYPLN